MNILADRLTKLREERNWTKTHVANLLGLKNLGTYANWEYGTREPDSEMITKIASLYKVTTDYILGQTNNPNVQYLNLTPEQENYLKQLSSANNEGFKIEDNRIEFNNKKQIKAKLSDPNYLNKQKERYDNIRKILKSFNVPDTPESREALLFFMFELKEKF
ncbi:helix-turn-helix domain-containing protein [Enterococcus ureilyticus]|uniref:helix-turn-helix domain-containing protein n=1 Tax=Enterococcus ureilyticus TaxID=1131292 RepID=UPI0009F2A91B|nr:helix-turn-helix transcriptional regulator [Enterococcus ureilyticus]MBM7688413.1 transcriptional regulator with XRE-family HTH domain [Enterococcus ureilyticus]